MNSFRRKDYIHATIGPRKIIMGSLIDRNRLLAKTCLICTHTKQHDKSEQPLASGFIALNPIHKYSFLGML